MKLQTAPMKKGECWMKVREANAGGEAGTRGGGGAGDLMEANSVGFVKDVLITS